MENKLIEQTLKGLIYTAIEKRCVLGDDATSEIEKLRSVFNDLVEFWDMDPHYCDAFDMEVTD